MDWWHLEICMHEWEKLLDAEKLFFKTFNSDSVRLPFSSCGSDILIGYQPNQLTTHQATSTTAKLLKARKNGHAIKKPYDLVTVFFNTTLKVFIIVTCVYIKSLKSMNLLYGF